jgi:ABC-type uncharacterized transport system involved in gliding motility auxiliary subunit
VSETFDDKEFGAGYVLKTMAAELRDIRNRLDVYATKAEVAFIVAKIDAFVTKEDVDKKMDEILQRIDRGPIAQWLLPTVVSLVSVSSAVYAFMSHTPGGH